MGEASGPRNAVDARRWSAPLVRQRNAITPLSFLSLKADKQKTVEVAAVPGNACRTASRRMTERRLPPP